MRTKAEALLDSLNELREHDEHAWAMEAAKYIRENAPDMVRLGVADALDEMTISNRRAVEARTEVVIVHLLKARQAGEATGPWKTSMDNARRALHDFERLVPTLKAFVLASAGNPIIYGRAKRKAEKQSGKTMPAACPFTPTQILDDNFYGT